MYQDNGKFSEEDAVGYDITFITVVYQKLACKHHKTTRAVIALERYHKLTYLVVVKFHQYNANNKLAFSSPIF